MPLKLCNRDNKSSVPFPFGKGGSGVLANCSLCGTEATLSFLVGPVCLSFLLKPVPFCKLSAGLGSTNKSATSPLILLSFCARHPVLLNLSFYLKLSGRSVRSCLFSSLLLSACVRIQWVPGHLFFQGNMADKLARQETLFIPSAIPCCLSSYLSYPLFFSQTRGLLSHLNSSKHRFFWFPLRNLISTELHDHACCVLSRLCCNGHSLLLSSYLTRIGRIVSFYAALADTSLRTPLISICTVQLQTLRHLLFDDSLSLYDLWSVPGKLAGF